MKNTGKNTGALRYRLVTGFLLFVIVLGLLWAQVEIAQAGRLAQIPTVSIPTVTSSPMGASVTVTREQDQINVRGGPSTDYPIVGVLIGGIDFTSLSITVGEAVITYGNFIQAIVTFLVIALALFLVVKAANKATKQKEALPAPPPPPSDEVVLLAEIRDLLKK